MKFVTVKQSGAGITGQVYIGTTHTAIQNAIDYLNAQGGGVVFIEKGIYTISSPIILYSNIEICGEWIHTVLKANFSNSGTNAVLSVYDSSNVYVHDLMIGNNVKTTAIGNYGIYAEYCGYDITGGALSPNTIYESDLLGKNYDVESGIKIEDCIVQGNLNSGIYLTYTSNSSISNCSVQYNSQKGIYISTSCINIRVKDNIVQNNGEGIVQINSHNNLYSNNITQNNVTYGINLYYNCINNIVIGNLTQYNGADGIFLSNSKSNSIIANSSQDNGDTGIYINLSDSNTVCGNLTYNSLNALYIESSSLNSIVGNGLYRSEENGFYLDSNSGYNSITGNSIHDNITGLNINGNNNTITGNVSITSDNNLLNSGINNIIAVNKTTNSA